MLNTYRSSGMNNLTEWYSAIRAEVPLPADPTTETNSVLIKRLKEADRLIVCGQAMSHCVRFTLQDVIKEWEQGKLKNIYLLVDGKVHLLRFL